MADNKFAESAAVLMLNNDGLEIMDSGCCIDKLFSLPLKTDKIQFGCIHKFLNRILSKYPYRVNMFAFV